MRVPTSQSIGGDGGTSVPYNQGFKARMIQRMAGPEGIAANALSKEVGVAQPTLSRWLRERSLAPMSDETPKQRRAWTPAQKLRVVQEASKLADGELGAFLRREGVHSSQLNEWVEAVDAASLAALTPSKRSKAKKSPEQKKIDALEKELNRKDKALAEVTAILTHHRPEPKHRPPDRTRQGAAHGDAFGSRRLTAFAPPRARAKLQTYCCSIGGEAGWAK